MAHLQYMPGDPRLVDQLVYELKSKGIFDQFRKECIADVDTRPAYQNLRQRVESSVATFLARQCWKPDLNKNQLREKLRKHILDGNYLEQGVERIVDQVVNPKVTSVFIPQVEDLVYNYLGITRKKTPVESPEKTADLLPTDLEAVSPGSVKSNDDKDDIMDIDSSTAEKMDIDTDKPKDDIEINGDKKDGQNSITEILSSNESDVSIDKSSIPLPSEEIKLENIPEPENSPPKAGEVELEKIALPKEQVPSTDIPLPEETIQKEPHFKPMLLHSEDSNSSSGSSLRRNMSPLTPIRNYNNENSCDAQQAFETDAKLPDEKEPSSFRFTIEAENSSDNKKKEPEQTDLAYQFDNQVNINSFNTPLYEDSSNSNNLRIDYESDANSKAMVDTKPEAENTEERKEKKDDRKSHKSSHRSRDSHRHSSSKDKRSDSKHSNSRDGNKHDKKSSSKDDNKKSNKDSRDRSKDRSDKKENRESSKHRTSKSSSHKDSKSHRSSSSSHRHSSKTSDDKKISSSSHKEKEKESKDKSSKDKSKDSRSSSHRSEKDKKGSSSKKTDDKDKKKEKKDIDDHYSSSGRGNHGRRSTDRDSNDGSSSSKGSNNQNGSKSSDKKSSSKSSSSKSDNTSTTSGDTSSPSDKGQKLQVNELSQFKPAVRVDNHLETPIATPPRLPFVPDITLKKPKFAANLAEARQMMKMRKFLDEEQKRMNQEAALLLEFQANVRPSLSQVYSSIPGPELEFACGANTLVIPSQSMIEPVNENLDNSDESDHKDVIQPEPQSVQQIFDIILGNPNDIETADQKNNETYDENKPFSKLVEEISEYGKASENKVKLEKVNDQSEQPKQEDNATNPTEDFEDTVIAGNAPELESRDKMDIDDDKMEPDEHVVVEEIESPPYEDITENPDVTDIKTVITDFAGNELEVDRIKVEENKKELLEEKEALKTERIAEDIEIPEVNKDTKRIVEDVQEISQDFMEESIENIKECLEKDEVVVSTKDEPMSSLVSLEQEEIKEITDNEKKIPEIVPLSSDKEKKIPEIISINTNNAKKVPDILPINASKENKDIMNEKKIPEIVPLNTFTETMIPETLQAITTNNKKIVPLDANKEKEIPEVIPNNINNDKVPKIMQVNTSNENKIPENILLNTMKEQKIPEIVPLNTTKDKMIPEIVTLYTMKEKIIPENVPLKVNKEKKIQETVPLKEKTISKIITHNEMKVPKMLPLSPKTDKISIKSVNDMEIDIEDELKVHTILKYFTNEEQIIAQSENDKFTKFFKSYSEFTSKLFLINCDTYEENIIKEVAKNFGDIEVVNYLKNGHIKVPNKSKNIVKDIHLSEEVTLPTKSLFSPTKSECSFELSSDYDAKLDEIVNKKSRQEVMEIILGGVVDDNPKTSTESIKSSNENRTSTEIGEEKNLKRKGEVESANDKKSILTPSKLRKLSDSDQISSTTEEAEEMTSNNNKVEITTRSKYLGRAKRVGLSRPKRCNLVNSPSSDKSVENYVQNTPPATVNGKLKPTPRSKVLQRYDTSDLYKPKLHYLSRRNNIT